MVFSHGPVVNLGKGGARSGGPEGKKNGAYKNGCHTIEAIEQRRAINEILRGSREALADVMKRFAFRTVVVERENKLRLEEDRWLRDYLVQSGCYRNTTSTAFRMEDEPCYRDITVDVFELTESLVRSVDHIDIMIPRSGRLIRLDLSGWS